MAMPGSCIKSQVGRAACGCGNKSANISLDIPEGYFRWITAEAERGWRLIFTGDHQPLATPFS